MKVVVSHVVPVIFITFSMAWFNLSLFGGCVLVEGSGRLSPKVGLVEGCGRLGVEVPPGVSSFLNKAEAAT